MVTNKGGRPQSRIVVMFKQGVTEKVARSLIREFGLKTVGAWSPTSRLLAVRIPMGQEDEWMREFEKHKQEGIVEEAG